MKLTSPSGSILSSSSGHIMDMLPIADPKLSSVLEKALERALAAASPQASQRGIYWEWTSFGISEEQVRTLFPGVNPQRMLQMLNDYRMGGLCLLELLGLQYHAKSIQVSGNFEEAMLSSCFLADEVRHISALRGYAPADMTGEYRRIPIVYAGWKVLGHASPIVRRLLIQVLGEGLAVGHYTHLASDCVDPNLKTTILGIIQDESAHHGTGARIQKTINENESLSPHLVDEIVRATEEVLDTSRGWPSPFLQVWEEIAGMQSSEELLRVLKVLDPSSRAVSALTGAKRLIEAHFPPSVVHELERRKAYHSGSASWALQYYFGLRSPGASPA